MPIINIGVRKKVATNVDDTEYICGNSDFLIHFDFDAEWDAYETKTARFIYGAAYHDIVFQGNQCKVPVMSNTNTILCGVFAGDLHTTTPALIKAQKSILCGNGSPAKPPEDVYAQIMELLNTLNDDIGKAVSDYLKENPIESGVPAGGKAGQYLQKRSDADGDVVWADITIPQEYGLVTYNQNKTITIS